MNKIRYILAVVALIPCTFTVAQESDSIWFDDGSLYVGHLADSLFTGFGKMIYADSTIYEGEWKEGMWNGTGILEYPDGDRYEGQFRNHQFDGEGKYYYSGGAYYTGSWKEGKFDGVGTLRYEDGSYYAGEWSEDKRNGYGVLYSVPGNYLISGTFHNDDLIKVDGEEEEYIEAYDPPFKNIVSVTLGMKQPFGIQYLAYTENNFIGLSLSVEPCNRTRGKESFVISDDGIRYDLVLWDEKDEEVIYEGHYIPLSLYLDFGYKADRLGFGVSLGAGVKGAYKNCRATDNSVFETGDLYYKTKLYGIKGGYRLYGQYSVMKFPERNTIYGTASHIKPELIFTLGYGNIDKLFFGIGYLF